jgi:hypothetical protein
MEDGTLPTAGMKLRCSAGAKTRAENSDNAEKALFSSVRYNRQPFDVVPNVLRNAVSKLAHRS